MGFLLLAIMIPFAATMIPLFQMFATFKLVNTTAAVILPAIATPFLVLLFRQASRSFPHEILEAARHRRAQRTGRSSSASSCRRCALPTPQLP